MTERLLARVGAVFAFGAVLAAGGVLAPGGVLAKGAGAPSSGSANASRGGDSTQLASFDRALATATLHFLNDLHFGRIDPRAAGFALGRPRPALDLAGILVQLAASADVEALIASVEPPFLHYRLLKKSLDRYRALAADSTLTALPPLPRRSVHAGERALRNCAGD